MSPTLMNSPKTPVAIRFAIGSLVVSMIVLALKAYAAHVTGSVALYSDALESIINVLTATLAIAAVWLSDRPADAALPYGYYKAEYFSAVIIGVFIALAAILIFREAYYGYVNPHPFEASPTGIAVSIGATVINAGWAYFLLRTGKRERSPALVADGKHIMSDVVSTVAVIIGVLIAALTGIVNLDAILAGLVGIAILWSGWGILRDSVTGLMDVAVDPKQLALIKEIIASNAEGAIEAHDIRTRQAGKMTFIDFHLVVPGAMTVEAAHAICDRIEAKLREAVENVTITIHVEPEEKAKHSGIVVV